MTMIERVARALWEEPSNHGEERVPWEEVPGLIVRGAFRDVEGELYDPRDGFRRAARAVIEAMREPTGAMVKAGDDYMDRGYVDTQGIFRVAFGAALEEEA